MRPAALAEAEAQLDLKQRFRIARARAQRLLAKADAHTDFMNDCVPQLMGYGKDQDVAIAACLNMWRDAWEEAHPDGAVDPGPPPPGSDSSEEKRLQLARARLRAFDESQHPRDPDGKWTDAGGGDEGPAPSPVNEVPTASGRDIKGLPNDIVIKDHLIAQAQERGAWDISAKENGREGSSGRERYELTVTAKIPEGIQSFKTKPDKDDIEYYDPKLAELFTLNKGEQYLERTYARPKSEFSLDTQITPLPDKDIIYRGMRAEEYEKFLQTGKIESTGTYNMAGQEGLTYWATDAATATSYANGFAPWPHKATFERPAYVVATKMPKETRHVPGVGDNEVGVARAITKDEIVAVWRGDVFNHTPGSQDIRPTSYDPKESTYEAGGGSGASSSLIWRRADAGFTDAKVAAAMDAALIRPLAETTAKKLGFNPELIEYSTEDKEFELAGAKYKYAGSYTFGDNKVTLYTGQLNSDNVKGVTAHEIGHRKFQLLTTMHKIETDMMMKDPGPPPDPNHQYWWGRKGGTDAIMNPQGEMREPYDKKYPLVHEWAQIQNMKPSLEQDDGITPYSKTYWSEWEKGRVNTNIAYHETMAEIARAQAKMGKHSAETGQGWRRLYRLQEKVWAENPNLRDVSTLPVKAIFILNDGVRWEVR